MLTSINYLVFVLLLFFKKLVFSVSVESVYDCARLGFGSAPNLIGHILVILTMKLIRSTDRDNQRSRLDLDQWLDDVT